MTEERTPLIAKIASYLDLLEKILLAGLIIGIVLEILHVDTVSLKIAIIGLAVVYFLSAFKVTDTPKQEDEKSGFIDLLALSIVPKVIWISIAVSLFGLLLYTLHLENGGYKKLLINGALGIGTGVVILGYAYVTGTRYLKYALPAVLRAVPVLLVDFYLLFDS